MSEHYAVFNAIGTGFLYWAALVGVASVVAHLRVWDHRSTMSTHLLFYMVAVATVLVLSAIRNLTGDSTWFQVLRLAVFAAVPVAMTQRLVLQIRAQRRPKHEPEKEPDGAA